jgi:hypothetical protein
MKLTSGVGDHTVAPSFASLRLAGWFRHNGQYEVAEQVEVGANTGVVQLSRGVLQLDPVPRPVWSAEAVRHIIGGLMVAGHRCRGRPSEVVVQHLSQRAVVG